MRPEGESFFNFEEYRWYEMLSIADGEDQTWTLAAYGHSPHAAYLKNYDVPAFNELVSRTKDLTLVVHTDRVTFRFSDPPPLGTLRCLNDEVTARLAEAKPSLVHIETATTQGTGVVVHRDGAGSKVVTAWHVIEDYCQIGERCVGIVVKQGGEDYDGRLLSYDEGADLALLSVPDFSGQPIPLAEKRPGLEDYVVSVGLPHSHYDLRHYEGIVVGHEGCALTDCIRSNAAAESGFSGGAVMNADGELVGVISGGWRNSTYSYAAGIDALRALLAPTVPGVTTATPLATPIPTGKARSAPLPIGATGMIELDGKTFELLVVELIRGTEAFERLREANRFNDPAKPGHEWMLFKLRVQYVSGPAEEAERLGSGNLDMFSSGGALYDDDFAVEPEPDFNLVLFPGASGEGWQAWQVAVDDRHPLLLFGADYRYRGGLWLALWPASTPAATPTVEPTATPTPTPRQ